MKTPNQRAKIYRNLANDYDCLAESYDPFNALWFYTSRHIGSVLNEFPETITIFEFMILEITSSSHRATALLFMAEMAEDKYFQRWLMKKIKEENK